MENQDPMMAKSQDQMLEGGEGHDAQHIKRSMAPPPFNPTVVQLARSRDRRPHSRRPDFRIRRREGRVLIYLRSVYIGEIVGEDLSSYRIDGVVNGEAGNWNPSLSITISEGQSFRARRQIPLFLSRLWDLGVGQVDVVVLRLKDVTHDYSIPVPDRRPLPFETEEEPEADGASENQAPSGTQDSPGSDGESRVEVTPESAQVTTEDQGTTTEHETPETDTLREHQPEGGNSDEPQTGLDRVLQEIQAIAAQTTPESDPNAVADRIIAAIRRSIAGPELGDPANLIPISMMVTRSFTHEIFLKVMEFIEHPSRYGRSDEEVQQMNEQIERLRLSRRGPYGVIRPFQVAEAAPDWVRDGVEASQGPAESLDGFWLGLKTSLRTVDNPEIFDAMFENVLQSSVITTVAPVVFGAGAAVGIGRSFWEAIQGLWELITNFPEMVESIRSLFALFFSGHSVPYAFGTLVGQHYAGELTQLANSNPVRFTFEIGKILGPVICMAVLAFIGITPMAALGAAAQAVLRMVRRSESLARAARRMRRFFRGRQRSPLSEMTDEELDMALEAMTPPTRADGQQSPLSDLTDDELDAAFDAATSPRVTGGRSNPRIEGVRGDDGEIGPDIRVRNRPFDNTPEDGSARPPRQRGQVNRADIQDIERRFPDRDNDGQMVELTMAQALARVRRVIGTKISDHPRLLALWNDAKAGTLENNVLTQDNFGNLYGSTRERFYRRVYADDVAREFLEDSGFTVLSGGRAPMLRVTDPNISAQEIRLSLDHILEKSVGDNWRFALDADNLRFEFSNPNSFRESLQTAFRMARAQADE